MTALEASGSRKQIPVNALQLNLRFIEPGEYELDPPGCPAPPRIVRLTRPYYIAETPVTCATWREVHTWAVQHGYSFANPGALDRRTGLDNLATEDLARPVVMVSWRDAIVWCNALSELLGLKPVYCADQAFTTPLRSAKISGQRDFKEGHIDNPFVDWYATGLRLPTDAEWEVAARGGKVATPEEYRASHSGGADAEARGWFSETSEKKSRPVGQKQPNALGLCDMSGNVEEWCWDFRDPPAAPQLEDPIGLPADPTWQYVFRRFRGGHFNQPAERAALGNKANAAGSAFLKTDYLGFRLAETCWSGAVPEEKRLLTPAARVTMKLYLIDYAAGGEKEQIFKTTVTNEDLGKIRNLDLEVEFYQGKPDCAVVPLAPDNEGDRARIVAALPGSPPLIELPLQDFLNELGIDGVDIFY